MRKHAACALLATAVALMASARSEAVAGCPPPAGDNPPGHFQCYETKPRAFPPRPVTVEDQFGSLAYPARFPHRLCAPADKNDEGMADPEQHLVGYTAKAKFAKSLNHTVVNQFGTIQLDVVRPDFLMLPSAKSLVGPPAPLTPPLIDHFQCYKVKRSRGAPRFAKITGVKVEDQFETAVVTLLKPTRLCAPANKNGEDPTAPAHPTHLLCYKTKGIPFPTTAAFTVNQFGSFEHTLIHRRELCVPSEKDPGSTTTLPCVTTTTTTTTVPTTIPTTSTTTTTTPLPKVKVAAVRFRSFANTGAEEIYLGVGDLGVAANRIGEQVVWQKPQSYAVTFTYDPGVPELRTTVNGGSVSENVVYPLAAPLAAMDSIEIVLADNDAGSQVDFTGVDVDGNPLGSFIGNGATQVLIFPSGILNDGFTFTGTLSISGPFSASQEASKVEILVGQNL